MSLNVGGKRNSGGIRDDESILCPTPPNREYSGMDFNTQPQDSNVKFFPPINVTVNYNNTTMMQPYFGQEYGGGIDKDKEIEQFNLMQMSKLE